MSNVPSIISDNCWGLGVYDCLNSRYESPFIAIDIHTPDYIKLLENFEYYMKKDLIMTELENSKYPPDYRMGFLGMLEDIEIFFVHYKSKEDAFEKWNRRKERINFDNMIVKLGTIYIDNFKKYDDFPSLVDRFHKLPFKKSFSFTLTKYDYSNNFVIKKEHVGDCRKKGKDYKSYGIEI